MVKMEGLKEDVTFDKSWTRESFWELHVKEYRTLMVTKRDNVVLCKLDSERLFLSPSCCARGSFEQWTVVFYLSTLYKSFAILTYFLPFLSAH